METMISRDDLVEWLSYWMNEQLKIDNYREAKELEFVIDTLLDDNWALLKQAKEVN